MTTAEALDKVQEFRQLLDLLDKEEERPGIRSEINQLMPLVRRIIGMTGQGKTVTIGPPPMIGGLVMKNINPFDILFTPPYGMFNDILSYCIDIIDSTIGVLKSDDKFIEKFEKAINEHKKSRSKVKSSYSNRVFVVHGRDNEKKEACARVLEHLGFEAIILHEQANRGKTIIEKFEDYSDVGFAVILMTPDDVGGLKGQEQKDRARQNVVFELGYFIGKFGRNRVMALGDGDIEIPTDISGVVYTALDPQCFWKFALAKELKEAGYEVDMNSLS
ncbi:TIR domain-containing protein [Prevotella sp. OH937_COT-195]|uniref:TIR domain-containing protein n=1 Tax=Prevotella sp. OH937_COT-195 TaxID=2491051 RepID=UPI000F64ADD2|nr:nucleotide-binding protein [Prevotella sp. OH937_COT-195]RRD01867.1 hypothetical protein EII32_05415 [Prevotella sp. OH937_COT-195]